MDTEDREAVQTKNPIQWLLSKEPTERGYAGEAIPRRELFFYFLGVWGQNHLYNMPGGQWFFYFLTNILHIAPATVGTITSGTQLFDAVNDPVAGTIIDNYRFKNGKKLTPWLKITSPFIAILSFLMFVNWNLPTNLAIVYSVVLYVLWDCLYSFQDAALWGLTAIIHPDGRQKARATQWADNGAFAGGLIPGLILGMLGNENGFLGLSQSQIFIALAVFLCIGGGFQTMFACKVTERVPRDNLSVSLFQNIADLRHNFVLWHFIASDVINSLSPHITDIYMFQNVNVQVGGKVMAATTMVLILATVTGLPGTAMKFIATKIADRVGGMKRIMIIGRTCDIVCKAAAFLIGLSAIGNPNGLTFAQFIGVYLMQMVSYLPNAIYGIAMRSLLAESVDYVEWKTGKRTEGITMSMRNFQSKITGAISKFVLGQTLVFLQYDAVKAGLGPGKNLQNAHFYKWAWPIYKLGPVLGTALSLLPLLHLKYPEELKRQVAADLAAKRTIAAASADSSEL
ncbi:MAG: MFS transporter [Oscillospiraceae bacterium]|jgi:Na+/melibiose symporter-like transporter|nr:MFS transporter [Oscillospiraceae bacterium]